MPDFQEQVRLGALRWLHSVDLNPLSRTYGVADREYWAWKTKDFANGTWQAGIAGILDARPLLSIEPEALQRLVTATLVGTATVQRRNGSFEEAYPYESSYAVTGLVVFNWLYAYHRAPELFTTVSRERLQRVVGAAESFLRRTPETHGVIANHRATTYAALALAQRLRGGTADDCGLTALLALQDPEEGWFPEYQGADPGYQTLLNHYLSAVQETFPSPGALEKALQRSAAFVEHFCFPDGSFAGEVGSRGTAIVYPSGLRSMHWFLHQHLQHPGAVVPTSADAGNFVPIFNSWAFAYRRNGATTAVERAQGWTHFPKAGLTVASTPQAFVVVSTRNGVVRKTAINAQGRWTDQSVVAFTHGTLSTQVGKAECLENTQTFLRLKLTAAPVNQPLNTAVRATVLRLIGWLFFCVPQAQRLLKRALSHFVMGGRGKLRPTGIEITVEWKDPSLQVKCVFDSQVWTPRPYGYSKHMASANQFETRGL